MTKLSVLTLLLAAGLVAQTPGVGLDGIVQTLLAKFDQYDIIALGEWHGQIQLDSDLRNALVRHPDFEKEVWFIVVEFASTSSLLSMMPIRG